MNKIDYEALKPAFRADGYVFLPGFLSQDEVNMLNERIRKFIKDVVPGLPAESAFYEDRDDPATLKQVFHLNQFDSYFQEVLVGSPFQHLAEALLEDQVLAKNLEFFNKPPRIGKPTPPHQDNYYFMLDSGEAVTMWLALEDVDEETGCVRYVRGSHLQGLRTHGRTQTLGFSQGMTDFGTEDDQLNAVAFPAKAGDLLVHHAMTIHWAEGNRSPTRSRQALGFVYFSESAREDVAAKQAYQQKLAAELTG